MAKKILLIEDEEIMIDVLQQKLSREGYEISVAKNGEDGLKLMREGGAPPDLVLLDMVMPKMGGFEIMAIMKKDEKLKNIPIIVISNSGQPVEINQVKALGAIDWLIKAEFDPQEVLVKVKKHIG